MKESKLNEVLKDLNMISMAIEGIQYSLLEKEVFTGEEMQSNEGLHFGCAFYKLKQECAKATDALQLISIFRNPDANKEFIEKLNFYASQEGAEQFKGSICPPDGAGQ